MDGILHWSMAVRDALSTPQRKYEYMRDTYHYPTMASKD